MFNSILINMLGTLPPECKSNWKNSIWALIYIYNCTHDMAMGFSSYLLMYRRKPWLYIDVKFRITPKSTAPTSSKYIEKLRDCIKWAHKRLIYFHKKKHNITSGIMIETARQYPWCWVTQSLFMSPSSRTDSRSKVGSITQNMCWNGIPIQKYQYMWYIP